MNHSRPVPWRGQCLASVCLLALAGCTTVDRTAAPSSGPNTPSEAHAPDDYPFWTRATSWLVAPFTGGASENVRF